MENRGIGRGKRAKTHTCKETWVATAAFVAVDHINTALLGVFDILPLIPVPCALFSVAASQLDRVLDPVNEVPQTATFKEAESLWSCFSGVVEVFH